MSAIPYNTGFFACQFLNTFDRLVANQSEIGHHPFTKLTEIFKQPDKILTFQSYQPLIFSVLHFPHTEARFLLP